MGLGFALFVWVKSSLILCFRGLASFSFRCTIPHGPRPILRHKRFLEGLVFGEHVVGWALAHGFAFFAVFLEKNRVFSRFLGPNIRWSGVGIAETCRIMSFSMALGSRYGAKPVLSGRPLSAFLCGISWELGRTTYLICHHRKGYNAKLIHKTGGFGVIENFRET